MDGRQRRVEGKTNDGSERRREKQNKERTMIKDGEY